MKKNLLIALALCAGFTAQAQSVADYTATPVCQGDTLVLTDNSVSTGNILKVYWDLDGDNVFTDDSLSTVKLSNLPAGTYNIGIRVISDIPDTNTVYKSVDIYPVPLADFSLNNSVYCLGDSVNVSLNTAANAGITTSYFWTDGRNDTFHFSSDTTLMYNSVGPVILKLLATSDKGCKDSTVQLANIRGSVPEIFASVSNVCVDEVINLSNISDTCGNILDVQWDLNGDNDYTDNFGNNITFSSAVAGNFPISMRLLTDRDTTTTTIFVGVEARPIVSFSVNDSSQVQPGNQFDFLNLSSGSTGVINYQWQFGDGNSSIAVSPSHTYNASGDFTVKLIATALGAVSCTDSVTLDVNVYPTEAYLTVDTVCFGDATTLSNNSISSETASSIEWDLDGDGQFDDGTGNNLTYVFNRFGSIPVRMRLTVPSGTYIASGIAEVLPKAFAGFISNEVCEGNATGFTSLVNAAPGVAIAQVTWDFDGDGTTDATGENDQNFTYTSGGTYTAIQIVSSTAGCIDSAVRTVVVYDAPVADFSATDVCLNTATDFTNNSSSAGDSITLYLWSLGDGNSRKDTGDFSYTYQTDGIFNVELYVQTIRGCNASISKNVEIFPLPQVSIETLDLDGLPASPEIIPGDSLELRINGNYAAISWVGQSSSSNAIRIGDAGTYQVLVTSAEGCSVNDEITITELSIPELVIRDVITPNGDLVNDELFVENLNYYAPLKIKFYHSSGAEIYSSEDYKNDWRPEYNSTLLTEGVYFYYAEDKLGNIYKGTISIVK